MTAVRGRSAVVTGGTDGIGAATALELRAREADVVIVGRSAAKAAALVDRAAQLPGPGSLRSITTDLSLLANAERVAEQVAAELGSVDLLLNAVGVLITRTAHTSEGLELDFAVGYLARFVLLERLSARGALRPSTRVINVAASAPKVPRLARLEFADLLTAQAAGRYGVTGVGGHEHPAGGPTAGPHPASAAVRPEHPVRR